MNFITRLVVPQLRRLPLAHPPASWNRAALVSLGNVLFYSTKTSKPQEPAVAGAANHNKKAKTSPKVTLIAADESISIVNLDEAGKIANRRNLKLVKITDLDTKTQRPVYRLMTGSEYLNEDLKRREEKKKSKQDASVKGDKLLTISARIAEHDLASKIQNVLKWLSKSYEVRIVVTGDGAGNKAKQEDIAQRFEASIKDTGKIVQKRLRDNDLRFNILPTAGGSAVGGKKGLLDVKETTNGLNEPQAARGLHTQARSAA
ncbi:translation initiation factor IF-3 [Anopheles merus]|uniref:Translation initiation factor 3 N-terminal domain-containing protein n=1 Tax=Anopheles merus TaxID=30066 RepID=A0A182VJP7_ANOME|nr:translation initiation factor IF-3 [Anopheles merus]